VVKFLLVGADAVMTTSSLLRHGIEHMTTLVAGLECWLEARDIGSLDRIRGKMRRGAVPIQPLAIVPITSIYLPPQIFIDRGILIFNFAQRRRRAEHDRFQVIAQTRRYVRRCQVTG
jgi:hypothetical protein